ncbi:MAG TPA: hypothetical protein PKV72_01345 [Candidatus Peribacteria bacterium]|nr:hypothetical protein [Candidatus Peribacteria bacterium]
MKKGVPSRPQPTGEYFLLYDTQGFGLAKRRYLQQAMEIVRDRVGDVLRRPDPIRFAMFGSATVRNLEDAADFLAHERPDQILNDRIAVVERDAGRLARHKHFAEERGMMDVELVAGDMNTVALRPGSVDLLLIDYTMAFNVALTEAAALDAPATDALYRATINNAASVLAPHGALVLNANIHPHDDRGDYLLRYDPEFNLYSTAIRDGHLQELLKEAGLDPGFGVEIPDIYWKPGKRMVVRHAEAVRASQGSAA